MEVSSIGAGLPVIALGLLAVVLAVEQQRGVVERRKYLPRRQGDDLDVLKPGERKDTEFGLILKDRGTVVGAVKLRYDADAEEFPLDGIVDAACKPVPWTTEQDESTQSPRSPSAPTTSASPWARPRTTSTSTRENRPRSSG